ncbi:RodZ domain-containing protein [Thermomonas sp.]|uniref:helix-turn-helix domain-containing protein n=1 Tax=Thermomonas sp. TaxID=1971895 RepID=UPI0031B9DD50
MTAPTHMNPDHAALAGCGERLRAARIAAGMSIDDVAGKLRMPARVVLSLEAEDWSRLGAPVFVRGQVRSYSRLLGLTTAPMMEALDVGPIEPTHLVSRTHTPKLQWWAEHIGRRLVYIVLTLSLAIPAWVATRQHLGNGTEGVAALDSPPAATGEETSSPATPRTLVASMAPVTANAAESATSEIVVRTHGEAWLEVVGHDGKSLEKALLPDASERRFPLSRVRSLTIGNTAHVVLERAGRPVDLSGHTGVARFTVSSDGSLVAAD